MIDRTLYRHYRSSGYDLNALIYWFLVTDNDLRSTFKFSPQCGVITLLTCLFFVVLATLSLKSSRVVSKNEKIAEKLLNETKEKLPRKESVLSIKPGYNCVYEHLQQRKIFQENIEKELCKEQLEIEILNTRLSCINKLLKPEAQTQWRRSRSPKGYCRLSAPLSD